MLKKFLNTACPTAMMLFDGNDDSGADPKTKLREQIAKGNLPSGDVIPPKDPPDDPDGSDEEGDEDEDDEDKDEELDADGKPVVKDPPEETAEQKVEREKNEKITAKAQRKQDRMQRRIDESIAGRRNAEQEVARLKAQLEADPDKKLTAEEVETRAKAIAAEQLKAREIEAIQEQFDKDCATLQKAANKVDKDFDVKIKDIAEQFGPIPSFMIGVLSDFDNGGEVLAKLANDEDLAEEVYDLQSKPAKMTRKLVEISNELIAAKKPPKKQISKVPDPVTPVTGGRSGVQSTNITEADTKNMDVYTRKRQAQILERRKAQGYN